MLSLPFQTCFGFTISFGPSQSPLPPFRGMPISRGVISCRRLQVSWAPTRWRAAAWVALQRELQTAGHLLASLRMCEEAHSSEGCVLCGEFGRGGEVGEVDGRREGRRTVEAGAECPGPLRGVKLSRHQLLATRHSLSKLALPPRRWKRPTVSLPRPQPAHPIRGAPLLLLP